MSEDSASRTKERSVTDCMWIFLDKEVFGEVNYLYFDRLNEVQSFVRRYFELNIIFSLLLRLTG